MDWQRLSTHEHAAHRFEAALLPVGTIEAHDGAPVGVDNYIPEALCARVAERLKLPFLPVMPYGVTRSLLAYPGSCGVSAELLERFLVEVGASLQRHGLRYLFVIDGHGGNIDALTAGAQRLYEERGLFTAVIEWWFEAEARAEEIFGPGGFGHAAVDELGLLAGLRSDLSPLIPRATMPAYYVYQGVKVYPVPRPVIVSDPADNPVDLTRLTPEKCTRFGDEVVDIVANIVRDILEGWKAIGRADGR
jgi:creatinine amidohydrolase